MIRASLQRVLVEEARAIELLSGRLNQHVDEVIESVLDCSGRLITCGIGKSGHIAAKAAATLASTGTPSFFLHAAEAVHGDLGMVTKADIVLMYSYSGETDELVRLFPSLKAIGARTILMTGRPDSSAARFADWVLDVGIEKEACPNNLAPTTSTTVMLALSDAIAVALMEARGFDSEDFAKFHPSGTLGRRLTLTVADVMRQGDDLPIVNPATSFLEVVQVIGRVGAGGACVVGDGGFEGYLSDGDLRRWLSRSNDPLSGVARDLMSREVATIGPELLAIEALEVFQNFPKQIGELPVLRSRALVGLLLLKDLLRAGIV